MSEMGRKLADHSYDRHHPVLLAEVVDVLDPRDGGVYVDGTFGAGGYSRAILERADCVVHAIDRDPNAIAGGASMVAAFDGRLTLIEGAFGDMQALLAQAGVDAVDGVALDVGVSSMQLDEAARGFSFMKDGPLDMRMACEGVSAADVVNSMPEAQLKRVIAVLGEERRAHAIVKAIARRRKEQPFSRTSELAGVIETVLGKRPGERIHPATRTFQALRIFVNAELEQLAQGLQAAERLLSPGGRLAVVSFHSLEDRTVKRFFAARCGKTARPSRYVPLAEEGPQPSFKDLTRGGIVPCAAEIAANPRARSARLRAGERTDAPAWAVDEAARADGLPNLGVF
jgi:16S rRNA (cytosine1402-N4)-methyltransferase